jgi:hypothetical protein
MAEYVYILCKHIQGSTWRILMLSAGCKSEKQILITCTWWWRFRLNCRYMVVLTLVTCTVLPNIIFLIYSGVYNLLSNIRELMLYVLPRIDVKIMHISQSYNHVQWTKWEINNYKERGM